MSGLVAVGEDKLAWQEAHWTGTADAAFPEVSHY
jgi:hypothetical protein